jgi:hypothetical protein
MRTAGKTGVAVGTLVWAAPLVQTTVPAWAAVGSGVPDPHSSPPPHSDPPHSDPPPDPHSDPHTAGGSGTTAGDTGVLGSEDARANSGSNGNGGSVIAPVGFDLAGVGEVARTGTDPWNLVKLAGGAIAIGGAARAVGRKLEQQDNATELDHDGGCVGA